MRTQPVVQTLLATSFSPRQERRSTLRLYEVVACVLILAAPLAAKSWRITDFQDNITVEPNGSAVVIERITLRFEGEWHGIHRTIPIEYPGPNGTNYELFLKITSVTDADGSKLKYESSVSNGARDLKIFIPDAVDATRTVEIAYQIRNGTRFFKDYDEFCRGGRVTREDGGAVGEIQQPLWRDSRSHDADAP